MATVITRLLLFTSSYSPLLVIFAIRGSFKSSVADVALITIAVLSLAGLALYLKMARSFSSYYVNAESAQPRSADAIGYLISYLLPFLSVGFEGYRQVFSVVLFFFLVGYLYVNSRMIQVNPVLNVIGYHIFEVRSSGGKSSALITRRNYLAPNERVKVVSLDDYVLLEVKQEVKQ